MTSEKGLIHYPGGKGRSFREIINLMPPHRRYIETHLGSGAVFRNKRPAEINIGIEIDPKVVDWWSHAEITNLKVIEGDALEVLTNLTLQPDDLVYCDPPYHPDTRKRARCYRHDYDATDHERLLDVLLDLPCRIVLSGYDNPLYAARLGGWVRTDYAALTHHGTVIESAWTNYVPQPPLHDYTHVGSDFRERERFKRRASGLARRIGRSDPLELHAALAELASRHPDAILAAASRIDR